MAHPTSGEIGGTRVIKKVAVLAAAAAVALATANLAQAAVSSNVSVPLATSTFVPCADGGAGEIVNLTGNLHILATVTFDSAGGVHGTLLFNPQAVSGVGSVSGVAYRGTGGTLSTFTGNVGAVSTLVNNFRIVGAGGAGSLQVHENVALVVDANGTLTASIDHVSVTCG
jgi:hypothetical protein